MGAAWIREQGGPPLWSTPPPASDTPGQASGAGRPRSRETRCALGAGFPHALPLPKQSSSPSSRPSQPAVCALSEALGWRLAL